MFCSHENWPKVDPEIFLLLLFRALRCSIEVYGELNNGAEKLGFISSNVRFLCASPFTPPVHAFLPLQYYDNTIFHRIIRKFMVQGGDPGGTGMSGESIYGKPFRDEIHTRIKFNHRGQVAMANENSPNTNHSQFFFTLDSAPHLDKKHTIFGKVMRCRAGFRGAGPARVRVGRG